MSFKYAPTSFLNSDRTVFIRVVSIANRGRDESRMSRAGGGVEVVFSHPLHTFDDTVVVVNSLRGRLAARRYCVRDEQRLPIVFAGLPRRDRQTQKPLRVHDIQYG